MSTPPEDREWLDVGELLEDPKLPPAETGRPAKWGKWEKKTPEKAVSGDPPSLRNEPGAESRPARPAFSSKSAHPLRPISPEEMERIIGDHFYDLTDVGNGNRFAAHNLDRVRFVAGKPLVWDGQRWKPDALKEARLLASDTARKIYGEAEREESRDKAKAIARWAWVSQNRSRIDAMLYLAESVPGMSLLADDLDDCPYDLNCANGTLDLHTGEIRDFDPQDLITHITETSYHPNATFDRWDKFLEKALPDKEAREFAQLAAGATLFGRNSADAMILIHGPPRSGKGTFQHALSSALGDYAVTAGLEDLSRRREQSGPRPELVRLRGARMASIYETSQDLRLSTGWLKTLTGGDPICVRGLHQDPIEFLPTFIIWLATNHAPKLPPDDAAVWTRIRKLAFDTVIPEAEQDPTLRDDLADPKVGGPAVLAWAVEGCRKFLNQDRRVLIPPKKVREDTEQLRLVQDHLEQFFDDCLEFGEKCQSTAKMLRTTYVEWCADEGEEKLSAQKVADRLKAKGCSRKDTNRQRGWAGVGLRAPKG